MVLSFMLLAFFAERLLPGVEVAERAQQVRLGNMQLVAHPMSERAGVGRFLRAEASVATALIRRTKRAASAVRDRAETRRSVRHHHTNDAAAFALHADAMGRSVRRAPAEKRTDHVKQLLLVDRAAAELEIDRDMRSDRRGSSERRDVLGPSRKRSRRIP